VASARALGTAAIQTKDKQLLEWGRAELFMALKVDYSMADLLLKLVAINLERDDIKEAQFIFDQFRRVDPVSPIVKYVTDNTKLKRIHGANHEQGSHAVAAEP